MRNIILLFVILSFCLSGCANRKTGPSFVGELPEADGVQGIAATAAALITELHAPGQTAIYIELPAKPTDFDTALENELRQKGFQLAQSQGEAALTVAYTVDEILPDDKGAESAWYLQLRLSDGRVFARMFSASGAPEPATTSLGGRP